MICLSFRRFLRALERWYGILMFLGLELFTIWLRMCWCLFMMRTRGGYSMGGIQLGLGSLEGLRQNESVSLKINVLV